MGGVTDGRFHLFTTVGGTPVIYVPQLDKGAYMLDGALYVSKRAARQLRRTLARQNGRPGVPVPRMW